MVSDDGESWITAYVPVDTDGRYRRGAPLPHLAKALWWGNALYGEYRVAPDGSRAFFWHDGDDSATDFLATPLRVGGVVRLQGPDEHYEFVVRSVQWL